MENCRKPFEVIINDAFIDNFSDRKLLSLLNDYEGGEWRYEKFIDYLLDVVPMTALAANELEALIDDGRAHSATKRALQNLRYIDSDKDDKGRGGEIAEILLYGIMKNYYKAIPAVPKIYHKQNVNDNAKGADSVHIVLREDGVFEIWLGEAKFYKDITSKRLDGPICSVVELLKRDKLWHELDIITDVKNLDVYIEDPKTVIEIKDLLNRDTSLDEIKMRLHIPILLLYECELTQSAQRIDDVYKNKIKEYHKERAKDYFSKQMKKLESESVHVEGVTFHLILIPVPNKKNITDRFYGEVKKYRG